MLPLSVKDIALAPSYGEKRRARREGRFHSFIRIDVRHLATPGDTMPGVGLMVRVVGLGSWGPEFKSPSAVELIPGGVNSACHPSKVGKMNASLLVGILCRSGDPSRIVPNSQGDCLGSTNALHRVWSQSLEQCGSDDQ